ncbi:Beta-galactosidase [Botrimarina colliarenosi]|uniref:Beta-galactosidase n=1 Tax=Botrimarina colliarenosi TaxID=2528001 RepID=A0A5C6A0G6_9BACT|nr:glycoside hydrolase family 2 TIM barrel-domain containing protein [Botrimarina colliarenosi]TWT92906.1 Beta-galactosidase [Botrimarina colliarenosi]
MTPRQQSQMRGRLRVALFALAFSFANTALAREADFNRGWKFTWGDPSGAEQLAFDDLAWQTVRTPHDAAIAGPFDPDVDGHAAKLPWRGVGWYRKWLSLDRREEGSRVYLDFDGVMAAPKIYVNGQLAGSWDYGYTPFRIDITEHLRFGRANVVALRFNTRRMETRWYPGAGIYRKVKLVVSPPTHLAHGGTFVTTPEVAGDTATVVVTNEVANHLPIVSPLSVVVRLLAPDGSTVAESTRDLTIAPKSDAAAKHEFQLTGVQRWEVDAPSLYSAVTELRINGAVVDRRTTSFGVRSFEFTADDGFWLNGRRVELHGVNLHHDLGPLGGAFNRQAAERQLRIMQDMGVNAIRTSHNPPAAEFLDLCDQLGLLVWDELFDKWDATAGRVNGEPSFVAHLQRHASAFVRRDRNHPSVIVWSIGNEILNQPHDLEGKSRERVRTVRDAFLEHDTTRPVGLGCHIPQTAESDILADLDLTGWNYQRRYALFRKRFPETPIVYSESASTVSTRGFYELPLPSTKCDYSPENQVSAFELCAAPWADLPEVEFDRMREDRFVAGEFVWTGFDYLGEPTPFAAVARSSYFGICDLIGLPKDRFYLYRSVWRPEAATVHLAPHWNWPERIGKEVPVMVYTSGDSAELFLNGRSLGVRRKGEAPPRPHNLALGAAATASSHQEGAGPELLTATSTQRDSHWAADPGDKKAWVAIDLGDEQPIESVALQFPRESKYYGYQLQASDDGVAWRTIATKQASESPRWGGVNEAVHSLSVTSRWFRVAFQECLDGVGPGIVGFSVFASPYEVNYFRPTYNDRIRWNEVVYEPGLLEAVAYKDGRPIGKAAVRTAGPVKRILLEADRTELAADGEDVAFVTATAVDENGTPCPLADNALQFSLTGPCELAGADNGNPLSLDPFLDDRVPLFNGQAMIVVRALEGTAGQIQLRVESRGLPPQSIRLESNGS